jgi:hypothetical protein
VVRNAWLYVRWIAGGEIGAWGIVAICAATLLLVALRRRNRPDLPRWLGPLLVALLVFLVAELLPFVPVRRSAPRFAIAAEVPLVLVLGACLGALHRLADGRWRAWLAAGVLAMSVAAMPYETLWQSFEAPRGASARHVMHALEKSHPDPAPGTRFVVLHGGPGLMASAWAFHRETWTGTPMLAARWPGRDLALVYRPIDGDTRVADLEVGVVYFQLHVERGMEPATPETLRRFFESATHSRSPGAAAAARARLSALPGDGRRGAARTRPSKSAP